MILKISLAIALTLGIACAADEPTPKKTRARKPAAPPAELTLPAGAKQIEPNTYTFTDAQGKKWIYRKTPFGLSKAEDKPPVVSETTAPAITATEDGDSVRFEKPGPFGVYKWQKKKSDLSDDEKAAWEKSQNKNANDTRE